jgi:hypothetical protein
MYVSVKTREESAGTSMKLFPLGEKPHPDAREFGLINIIVFSADVEIPNTRHLGNVFLRRLNEGVDVIPK